MPRIASALTLFAALVSPLFGTEVVVNSIPGDARFVNYGVIDWKGATITPDALKDVGSAVSSSTEQVKTVASDAGADLVVLISPESGVFIPQSVVRDEIRLRKKDPVFVAVFFKMKSARKASPEEKGIRFTTEALLKAEGASIDMKIDQASNTAGVTLSYWVYMNLPRFVAEAAKGHYDTITIKSNADADCEEVWLPGCDNPLRISKKKPQIDCSIYKRRTNHSPAPAPTTVSPATPSPVAPTADAAHL